MATDDPIGTRIAKRRQQMRLSQQALAGLLGVSKKSVSMWETGKHYPHRHLGLLEQVLGVDLTGDGQTPDPNEEILKGLDLDPDERAKVVEYYRELRAETGGRRRTG